MPKREDLKKIMVIGSGPIIIGQACEFDYSGTQAIKALKEEGYAVVLINSNPATIMTDPELADKTYIEPITSDICAKIIEKERPDALLPTIGGQTALNIAVELHKMGILEKYNVELIGAKIDAINKAENRELFKKAMDNIGLEMPRGSFIYSLEEALAVINKTGFPAILRPSFTLGGSGSGIAYNLEDYKEIVQKGLAESPINEILVEESIIGWKEFEIEIMRDLADNVIIICSIENFDPMGIHTGDSITVAPAQTLTDVEYQIMREASIKVIKEIGVATGGSNIQFAINPKDGRMVVIEMNPRVSRSSALASKATGFPIAKIAAKLAVGYTLDEIPNDITRETPASFEPAIDYVVTKVPRFAFDKFTQAEAVLTTQMKSVGEVMAIGRTFKESLQKALRGLETNRAGLGSDGKDSIDHFIMKQKLIIPNPDRIYYVKAAIESGMSLENIFDLTKIDPWFLTQMKDIVDFENEYLRGKNIYDIPKEVLYRAKQFGFSDKQISFLTKSSEGDVREHRKKLNLKSVYKAVDTCAGEFEAYTPYFYSTYEDENEAIATNKKKIIILGGGPNRIGQGIEFDYCCVHASFALKEEGYEAIMINSNPETVSTDYDTSSRLYFEPLTFEDVMSIVENEKPEGIVVQFGGQTPLKLSVALEKAGVKILGTSSDAIDRTEDRKRFGELLNKLELKAPPFGTVTSEDEAIAVAQKIGYPVLIRPSYVLGGQGMVIVYSDAEVRQYMRNAVRVSSEHPVLIDKFLQDAVEVDVDAISDGETIVVAGIMQHIEEAGIHSGDSAAIFPPVDLSREIISELISITKSMIVEIKAIGLINVQYAIKDNEIYIIEVNPRASRTVPFISKAIGVPLAKLATKVLIGKKLKDLGYTETIFPKYVSVKESVFPFNKFAGVDPILSPEMKSTGEVMGIDEDFGLAFAKSQLAAGSRLPAKGKVFISVCDKDKVPKLLHIAKKFSEMGFDIVSTAGTFEFIKKEGIKVAKINKIHEGSPNVVDSIKNKEISLMINTPVGRLAKEDDKQIRTSAVKYKIPYTTTLTAALATVRAVESLEQNKGYDVKCIQDYYKQIKG